jgi:hypothetical protein
MRLVLVIIMMCLAVFLQASDYEHRVGIAVGAVSGTGASYRWFYKDFGLQVAQSELRVGFSEDENEEEEDYTFKQASIGLQGLYTIHQTDILRTYIIGGVAYFDIMERDKKDGGFWEVKNSHSTNIGTGLGSQLTLFKHLSLAIELPMYYSTKGYFKMQYPQIGVFYKI